MTESHARTTANVLLTVAAGGAAVYVMRNPPLRRLAWRLARQYAAGPLAAWAVTAVARAWDESDRGARRRSIA